MNDIDEVTQQIKLPPLYRLFTAKLLVILLTVIVIIGLIVILFYQDNVKNNILVEQQLVPLTQQFKNISALHKADKLIDSLLISANVQTYVSLHAKLISIDRQLLQLNHANGSLFQKWLNKHQSAEDVVSRIQDSYARNQQLKQSSIIQLQLMLLSMTPIIDKKLAAQKLLYKQLNTVEAKNDASFSQINVYVKSYQYLNDLQKLQSLLAQILMSFERLTMHTPITHFELLRLNVEQAFIQSKRLKTNGTNEVIININQQMDAFAQIVLTEQRALAKWQGYIRLAQNYHANLKEQQQQISQLLLVPYKPKQVNKVGVIQDVLAKFNIQLSNANITLFLMCAIAFSVLFFCYLLWQLREQIKFFSQQGVESIISSLQIKEEHNAVASYSETHVIIEQIQKLAKPQHSEKDFQLLSEQYQSSLQLNEQKEQALARLDKCHEQQQIDINNQISDYLNNELQRYQHLETNALAIMQQQAIALNFNILSENKSISTSVATKLALLYQQLTQFHLALEVQLDKSVLNLTDINLVDEIHAILFNKQEQQQDNNQLFVSCDEQLLSQTKIDFRLFQQLLNLFIDILLEPSLDSCHTSQLHLHVQLQDKNTGQQLVHFGAKVVNDSSGVLPDLINQLLESQTTKHIAASPFMTIFNTFFVKQHGKNIVAQLADDGYQISFELPLAIVGSTDVEDSPSLKSTKIILLSNNTLLAEVVENNVYSVQGEFEKLTRIDSFQQQLNSKYLQRHKLDLLMVGSDMALTHLDLITKQIDSLPKSLQPKLMILQSRALSYNRFGFYSQVEHVLCKDNLLHNIKELLASDKPNNQIQPCEQFTKHKFIKNELPVLLAVHSPQYTQNLHRLLIWLGFQVKIVAHEAAQQALWQTGEYCLLLTEFAETACLDMASKPLVKVGVFSLSDVIPASKSSLSCDNWHLGKLNKESTLAELIDVLSPWLKQEKLSESTQSNTKANDGTLGLSSDDSEDVEEFILTEVPSVLTEHNANTAAFDFAQYLQHQGTAELALFMLDDYTQNNHQQLDALVEAIKAKNIEDAQLAISALALNAKILSAQELQSLCAKWLKLLTGKEIPSSLNKINALLKETRVALNKIDEYAESI